MNALSKSAVGGLVGRIQAPGAYLGNARHRDLEGARWLVENRYLTPFKLPAIPHDPVYALRYVVSVFATVFREATFPPEAGV